MAHVHCQLDWIEKDLATITVYLWVYLRAFLEGKPILDVGSSSSIVHPFIEGSLLKPWGWGSSFKAFHLGNCHHRVEFS